MKKFLTFGIMLLFLWTSVASSLSNGIGELSIETFSDEVKLKNHKKIDNFCSSSLFFTENKGQFSNEVLFQTYVQDATVYLCKNKIVTVFTSETKDDQINEQDSNQIYRNRMLLREPQKLEMISIVAEFVDSNPDTVVIGGHQISHKNNYFIGNNPEQWYIDVPNYQSLTYQNIYPGIDLIYYGSDGLLKYDFIVQPGADPSQITVHYQGAENIELTSAGELVISTRLGSIHEKQPVIYQEINDVQHLVQGGYLLNDNIFSFLIEDSYNQKYPLIIDPGLVYSTYLGGSLWEWGTDIAVDSSGCAYIIGDTFSSDFPVENPYSGTINGELDAVVTKFSPQGNTLVYSTYLGGSELDIGGGIFVDSSKCVYIVGSTNSTDFPLVNPFNDTLGGLVDGYVTKFSSSGNELIYSTYLGGTYGDFEPGGLDYPYGIEVDSSGCAYVSGWTFSEDFPMENPYDGTFNGMDDVFLTKFSPQGDTLIYSTYLGGPWPDECDGGLAVDSDGCAYVTGLTYMDFPVQNGYDSTYNGEEDAFLTKFSPEGNTLVYSTYLGGAGEEWGWDVVVDNSKSAYAIGFTRSSDYPTINAYDDSFNGGYSDVYVTKFSPEGDTLEYSTFLGGTDIDGGIAVAVDGSGCAYVTGFTDSNDFPTVNPFDGSYNGDTDAFVTKFSSQGNTLEYSTYLGGAKYDLGHGIDVDGSKFAYVFGYTRSTDYPLENPFDDTYNDNRDLFLTKFPEDGGGIIVKPMFLLGFIESVKQEGNYTFIIVNKVLSIRLLPPNIRLFSSGEEIIISNDYLGFIGKQFMIGRFKADLD